MFIYYYVETGENIESSGFCAGKSQQTHYMLFYYCRMILTGSSIPRALKTSMAHPSPQPTMSMWYDSHPIPLLMVQQSFTPVQFTGVKLGSFV